jgi:hypothetical protein
MAWDNLLNCIGGNMGRRKGKHTLGGAENGSRCSFLYTTHLIKRTMLCAVCEWSEKAAPQHNQTAQRAEDRENKESGGGGGGGTHTSPMLFLCFLVLRSVCALTKIGIAQKNEPVVVSVN